MKPLGVRHPCCLSISSSWLFLLLMLMLLLDRSCYSYSLLATQKVAGGGVESHNGTLYCSLVVVVL